MKTRPYVFAALLTSVSLVTPAWSQEAPLDTPLADPVSVAPDDSVSTEPELIIQGAEPTENIATKNTNGYGNDTLSVDFPDEDIRNILRNVADLFELNLVVPDTLQGRTSIKLRDVSWRQIYQVVLDPVGFTYIEEGNIIKIVSRESLLQEPVATEVFILNYALAEEILPTLSSLVDAASGGKIVVNSRSNALIITERPSQMNRIRPIIEALDKATAQVMIESKFVEVTNSDIKNIGVNWSSLAGMRLGVSDIKQTWSKGADQNRMNGNDVSNTVNAGINSSDITGTESKGNTANGNKVENVPIFHTGTDPLAPPVTSTTFPGGLTTGASSFPTTTYLDPDETILTNTITSDVSNSNSTLRTTGSGLTNSAANTVTNLIGLTNASSQGRLASAVFSASDFNIILSALKQQNDTKLVSNPTVVTLNNTEAVINIGKEYPIPNYTYNQERGTYEVSGFEYRPIGIILKVTPQVNSRGFIKLTIEPEVSSSTESAVFGGASIPIVTTRKTKTQVSLRDGFTMAIGGLMENSEIVGSTRVPVLGSIPFLGRLFRSDSKNNQRRNLIIFITAKTVSAEGATIEELFDSRVVRQLDMNRRDLPGYRDGSDPFLAEESAK